MTAARTADAGRDGDVIGDKTRGAEAMVEDFHLDWPPCVWPARESSMRVPGAIEAVRLCERRMLACRGGRAARRRRALLALAAGGALALVVYADEIELRAFESNFCILVRRSFMPAGHRDKPLRLPRARNL